jgi:hypothetical protein
MQLALYGSVYSFLYYIGVNDFYSYFYAFTLIYVSTLTLMQLLPPGARGVGRVMMIVLLLFFSIFVIDKLLTVTTHQSLIGYMAASI